MKFKERTICIVFWTACVAMAVICFAFREADNDNIRAYIAWTNLTQRTDINYEQFLILKQHRLLSVTRSSE